MSNKAKQHPQQSKPVQKENDVSNQQDKSADKAAQQGEQQQDSGASQADQSTPTQAGTPTPSQVVATSGGKTLEEGTSSKRVSTAPVTAADVEPIANRAVAVDAASEESEIKRILGDLSTADTTNIHQLQYYIREMAPGRMIKPSEGARQQVALYSILKGILNTSSESFETVMIAALKLFEIHRNGVFHPSQVLRFLEQHDFSLGKTQTVAFMSFVNLFTMLGPVKGRELMVKTIDFDKSLRHDLTDEARERVRAFFKA